MELLGQTNLQIKILIKKEITMILCSYSKCSNWYRRNTGCFGGNYKFGSIIRIPGRVVGV